jgi:peroxiredoxin
MTVTVSGQKKTEQGYDMKTTLSGISLIDTEGDTLSFKSVLAHKKLVALFFCFNGCTGCKISMQETLAPNHEMLKSKYDLEIIIISKEEGKERERAEREYSKYPFLLLFDVENRLFAEMPPAEYGDGRRLKAWPTLILINSDFDYRSVNPFSVEHIEKMITEMQLSYIPFRVIR